MNANATVNFKFAAEKQLKLFVDALYPEANHPEGSRANVELRGKETFLCLKINAKNTNALRSTLNAYLRWISSITNLMELLS